MRRRNVLSLLGSLVLTGCASNESPPQPTQPQPTSSASPTADDSPTTPQSPTESPTQTVTQSPPGSPTATPTAFERVIRDVNATITAAVTAYTQASDGSTLLDVTAATTGFDPAPVRDATETARTQLQDAEPTTAFERATLRWFEACLQFINLAAECQPRVHNMHTGLLNAVTAGIEGNSYDQHAGESTAREWQNDARTIYHRIETNIVPREVDVADAFTKDDVTAKIQQFNAEIEGCNEVLSSLETLQEIETTLEDAQLSYEDGSYRQAELLARNTANAFTDLQAELDTADYPDSTTQLLDTLRDRASELTATAEELERKAANAQDA